MSFERDVVVAVAVRRRSATTRERTHSRDLFFFLSWRTAFHFITRKVAGKNECKK